MVYVVWRYVHPPSDVAGIQYNPWYSLVCHFMSRHASVTTLLRGYEGRYLQLVMK